MRRRDPENGAIFTLAEGGLLIALVATIDPKRFADDPEALAVIYKAKAFQDGPVQRFGFR